MVEQVKAVRRALRVYAELPSKPLGSGILRRRSFVEQALAWLQVRIVNTLYVRCKADENMHATYQYP